MRDRDFSAVKSDVVSCPPSPSGVRGGCPCGLSGSVHTADSHEAAVGSGHGYRSPTASWNGCRDGRSLTEAVLWVRSVPPDMGNCLVLDGNWHPSTDHCDVEQSPLFQALRARVFERSTWEETEFWAWANRRVRSGETVLNGAVSEHDLALRAKWADEPIESLLQHGLPH